MGHDCGTIDGGVQVNLDAEAKRWRRSLDVRRYRWRRVGDRRWRCEKPDGTAYTVDLAAGDRPATCTCPDAYYRGGGQVCKHILCAREAERRWLLSHTAK